MLVVAAAVFSLSACTSSPAGVASSTSTSHAPPSTAPVNGEEAGTEVLAAYRSMWSDLVTAASTSDYRSPLLAQHASGTALKLFVQGLARDQLAGIVTRGEPTLDPRITSLSPAADPMHATVSDCFDDTHWVEFTTSGKRAKNAAGGRRATTAVMVREAGTWKTTELTVGNVGTC